MSVMILLVVEDVVSLYVRSLVEVEDAVVRRLSKKIKKHCLIINIQRQGHKNWLCLLLYEKLVCSTSIYSLY